MSRARCSGGMHMQPRRPGQEHFRKHIAIDQHMKISLAVFLTIVGLLSNSCARPSKQVPAALIECQYFPNLEPAVCEMRDQEVVVPQRSLANISFGPDGLGAIVIKGRELYFVTRQGKTAPALNFDNGPDYFVEGLARTVQNGHVGFVDTHLVPVVAPVWDFAWPFQGGVAKVCMGCVETPAGEHRIRTGGKWGYIDKHGKVVVPVIYDAVS